MDAIPGDVDELVEFWTLLDEDRALLSGKRGATGLGFALLLKHYSRYGRFPRGRSNVPDAVVRFVGRQLGVDSSELNLYEWSGRTIEYHRAQIRTHLGFRVATVDDQEKLTSWLAANVAHDERRLELVREELLARFRTERIEPPTSGRLLRMVRSALRTAAHNWAQRISERLDEPTSGRLLNLIVVEEGGPETDGSEGANEPDTVLGLIKLRCTTDVRHSLKGLCPCLLDLPIPMSSRLMPCRW
ncbi:transposase [Arthrobacter sp. Hiyo4]|nr:transposase [Arthrobacter sp. Hiyo4]